MSLPSDPTQPPPGWMAISGILEPAQTVGAYLVRGERLKGRCASQQCRRTCEVDLVQMVRSGHGALPRSTIERLWRCQALDHCSLQFHAEGGGGMPIQMLLGRPHVRIRFKCRGCDFCRASLPDKILARVAAQKGSSSITVEELSKLPHQPCQNCGKTNWQIDVLWPNVNSVGYRIDQQRAEEAKAAQTRAAQAMATAAKEAQH